MTRPMVRTTCPYCGVGCGIQIPAAAPSAGMSQIAIEGDPRHPANFGRLCGKGAALGETLDLEDRLLYPEVDGRRVSWDRALAAVAEGFGRVIAEHGPEAVAFYVSGQLLTEDYYVANKLMKGFIGSANIDTNSRLCMSSSVAGHQRAFGGDTVPGNYEDLEQAELLVLVGSNLAWCHPVLYQRILARRGGLKIVVIDPRRTATAAGADLHLALKPGTDTVLFNGLLNHLYQSGGLDEGFLAGCTEGFGPALLAARQDAPSIAAVAGRCGLPYHQVAAFYEYFIRHEKTVTVYSQGVNQSSCGSDKVNAIINCHLASGRIGRPGQGPFSVTGQPNAMGGREVGGMANQLAAHMDFSPEAIDRVGRFWNARRMARKPGLKALDLFQAVAEGKIRAIWIMGTNPAVSVPDADAVEAALRRCPLVVVSDACAGTDTVACASVRLPARTWGEKDGTVTNSERRISRQRAFLASPGEARPDWWIITQVARRLGWGAAFPYDHPAQIFREHAALSGFENAGGRAFDIGALADLSDAGYDALEPLHWPFPAGAGAGTARLFGDGRFYTPNRRARLIAVGSRRPANPIDDAYPLVLNTGRVRDHWHTLTRTGKSPRLSAHSAEPYAEIHPVDALAHDLADGALARILSRWGEVIARVRVSEDQQVGSIFVPMHWSGQFAGRARIDAVVNPARDPVSGQPEAKHTPVRMQPYRPGWQGFILSRVPLDLEDRGDISYWVKVRERPCWRYELAGEAAPADWNAWARAWLGQDRDLAWIDYRDSAAGCYRAAALENERLIFCLFIAPSHGLPPRAWLTGLFAQAGLQKAERLSLLSGRPPQGQTEAGRIICSCFGVGLNTLVGAIHSQGLTTPEAIGRALQAGTNCGSCVPELRDIIAHSRSGRAA